METHGVTVRSIRALRGPTLYAYMPVLKVITDIINRLTESVGGDTACTSPVAPQVSQTR